MSGDIKKRVSNTQQSAFQVVLHDCERGEGAEGVQEFAERHASVDQAVFIAVGEVYNTA